MGDKLTLREICPKMEFFHLLTHLSHSVKDIELAVLFTENIVYSNPQIKNVTKMLLSLLIRNLFVSLIACLFLCFFDCVFVFFHIESAFIDVTENYNRIVIVRRCPWSKANDNSVWYWITVSFFAWLQRFTKCSPILSLGQISQFCPKRSN